MSAREICRICLITFNIPLIRIFENDNIKFKIMECASVEIHESDRLPKKICPICLIKLNEAYEFRLQIIRSDAELKHNLRFENFDEIKEEPETVSVKEEDIDVDNLSYNNLTNFCESVCEQNIYITEEKFHVDIDTDNKCLTKSKPNRHSRKQNKITGKKRRQKYKVCLKNTAKNNIKNAKKASESVPCKESLRENNDCGRIVKNSEPCKCLKCGEEFETKSSLSDHLTFHRKTHLCSVCGKSFNNTKDYRNHIKVHDSNRPHACRECGKSFKYRNQLKEHCRTHTGQRPHVCHVCGKAFAHTSTLNTHVKRHLGVRPHTCMFCEKSFVDKATLTKHIRSHTGEQPFACEYCGRCFSGKWNLTQHLRLHTDEKPYRCQHCQMAFTHNVTLKQHVRSKHNVNIDS